MCQLTIISNILSFLGKEFLDRSLIQPRSNQNSQHFVGTPMPLEVMLNNSHHAICSDGRVFLDSDSSLCRTPKGFDHKMLLNLFKKFCVPMIFIMENNLCGRCLHIVGQVDKCLVLVSRIVCDAAKNSRMFLFGKVIREFDNKVRNNAISIMHGIAFVNELPEHHDEQMILACEMFRVFVSFVFRHNSIKDSLWQEFYELSEDIFSGVHRMTDLLLDSIGGQFKSSPSVLLSKTLNLNDLQTFSLTSSGQ